MLLNLENLTVLVPLVERELRALNSDTEFSSKDACSAAEELIVKVGKTEAKLKPLYDVLWNERRPAEFPSHLECKNI